MFIQEEILLVVAVLSVNDYFFCWSSRNYTAQENLEGMSAIYTSCKKNREWTCIYVGIFVYVFAEVINVGLLSVHGFLYSMCKGPSGVENSKFVALL
jgi:fucose permease